MRYATTVEFGDFQTPPDLATLVCERLAASGTAPASVLEPSAGIGNLFAAAFERFPSIRSAFAIEINKSYAEKVSSRIASTDSAASVSVVTADFFSVDLAEIAEALPDPVLVLGNPPWVTSAALSTIGSSNVPTKVNFKGLSGIEAVTGKSNFDIAEWFLLRLVNCFAKRRATIALLCKTSVARSALTHIWRGAMPNPLARLYRIDALAAFGASVDACLLVLDFGIAESSGELCEVYSDLKSELPASAFGLVGNRLVSNARVYLSSQSLVTSARGHWRSGVKHDCAAVMELTVGDRGIVNGSGDSVLIEPDLVYPLFKATRVFHGEVETTDRRVIVTQNRVGAETSSIALSAPLTWKYLQDNGERLDARKSSIYRGKPRFAIFGVGPYTFSPWKVCISGLHKELRFRVLGPIDGRPPIVDDTVYFLPANSEEGARLLARLLQSEEATRFFQSLVFWDAKRPITIEILSALDLDRLAERLGTARPSDADCFYPSPVRPQHQSDLFAVGSR